MKTIIERSQSEHTDTPAIFECYEVKHITYKQALLNITSYRGQCVDAVHYYGELQFYHNYEYIILKLTRPLKQEEIDNNQEHYYCLEEGDLTQGFNSVQELISFANEVFKERFKGIYELFVDGIPNNRKMPIAAALKPLDLRIKCASCKKIITGGCYNMGIDKYCPPCYENTHKKKSNTTPRQRRTDLIVRLKKGQQQRIAVLARCHTSTVCAVLNGRQSQATRTASNIIRMADNNQRYYITKPRC